MRDRDRIARGASDRLAMHLRSMSITRWQPLPHQIPPPGEWRGWLLLAGRGAGKTDACAKYITDHVNGPACLPGDTPHWIGIIAPTLGDAATSCVNGPSGLKAHNPAARLFSGAGGLSVRWPNGSEAKLFGAHTPEDVERLRSGGNRCVVWAEELAAWRYLDACWPHMRFGLRVGQRPHWVASTTPKPRPLIKKLDRGEVRNVAISRASMYDNPHLDEELRQELEDEYGGTQLGRQELHAEVLDQDENALWTHEMLDRTRVASLDLMPANSKRSVGVDPSGGAGEQGIVVVGKTLITREHADARNRVPLAHGYVLADRTVHMSPDGWGRRAVQAAVDYEADDICVEINYGGDMAIGTIRAAADSMGIAIPVRKVTASRGKKVRASPVSALTEQNRWHLVGVHPELEDQLCTWHEDLDWSPDRLDAMVWPAWHQRIVKLTMTGITKGGKGLAAVSEKIA